MKDATVNPIEGRTFFVMLKVLIGVSVMMALGALTTMAIAAVAIF